MTGVQTCALPIFFEVQENSDVTFRLYDWDHIDPKTGHARLLQIEQALACIDFAQGPVSPVTPAVEGQTPALRERLFDCRHFRLWRIHGASPFAVGDREEPRVAVCIEGSGCLRHGGVDYAFGKGDVMLLPAAVGACLFQPEGAADVLEIAGPESA